MVATSSDLSLVSRNALKVGEKEKEFVLTLFRIMVSNGCPVSRKKKGENVWFLQRVIIYPWQGLTNLPERWT